MSMSKRYLDSLPADEQNAILGRHDERDDDRISTGRMAVLCLPTLMKGREERRHAGLNPDGPGAILGGIDNAYISPDEQEDDEKQCKTCGKTFTPKTKEQVYCSLNCAGKDKAWTLTI